MIGLKRGTVKLVEHNPEWKQNFAKEEKEIRRVLGQDCIDVQHVGSTAIPGILAKPMRSFMPISRRFSWRMVQNKMFCGESTCIRKKAMRISWNLTR